MGHCAPTYSATLALLTVGTEEAYAVFDRKGIYSFFMSVKKRGGGFSMHVDGEADVRASYTVLAVASLLNILTPELCSGVAEYVASCQTYEGGFGGEPHNEAHGGYTFCGLAALVILGKKAVQAVDMESLCRWVAQRQMQAEGGFQGRTNKLVDACYSFWQGALPSLLHLATDGEYSIEGSKLLFDSTALQKYILACSQDLKGGLRDKPSKYRDFYHTCYALSGLSMAQASEPNVVGLASNRLCPTSCVFNIRLDKLDAAKRYFSALPCSHNDLSHQ